MLVAALWGKMGEQDGPVSAGCVSWGTVFRGEEESMRKHVVFVALVTLAFVAAPAHARGEIIGFKLGVNVAEMEGDWADIGIDDYRIGFTAGLTVDVPVARGVSFQSGLLYSQKGAAGAIDASLFDPFAPPGTMADVELAFDYVDIPLLLKGGRGNGFFQGGLNIGIITNAEFSVTYMGSSETIDISDSTRDLDFSLVLGFGYRSRDRRFSATAQYSMGLEDAMTGSIEAKNRVLSLGVGFSM